MLDKSTCPLCESVNVVKNGRTIRKGGKVQRYACNDCGHTFTVVMDNA